MIYIQMTENVCVRLVFGRYPVEYPSSFSERRIYYFPQSILAHAGQSQENL
jgi:hypothetical protein